MTNSSNIRFIPAILGQPSSDVLKSEVSRGTSDVNRQCIPIGSGGYSFAGSSVGELLQLNPRQKAIWHRLKAANGIANLVFVILGVGAGGLFAYQYHTTSWEAPLPDNQWTLEVEHWFTTILVLFQSTTTYYVTGTNSRYHTSYSCAHSSRAD